MPTRFHYVPPEDNSSQVRVVCLHMDAGAYHKRNKERVTFLSVATPPRSRRLSSPYTRKNHSPSRSPACTPPLSVHSHRLNMARLSDGSLVRARNLFFRQTIFHKTRISSVTAAGSVVLHLDVMDNVVDVENSEIVVMNFRQYAKI
jgi:hypothetical protein